MAHTPARFNITWDRQDYEYRIDIPNYEGGNVMRGDVADALVDVAEEVIASATVETPEKLLAMARAALEAAKK
jgi:hypothetical protein